MTYSTAYSKEFELVDINCKPANDGKLKCDNCQNSLVSAIETNAVDEMKYFCSIMHTMTWTTTEQTMVKVCSKQLPELEATSPVPTQAGISSLEQIEYDLSDLPSVEDFEPDTKPFLNNG